MSNAGIETKHVLEDGETGQISEGNTFTMRSCCDCELTHLEWYHIEKNILTLRFYRDADATRKERRKMKTEDIKYLIGVLNKELRRRKK